MTHVLPVVPVQVAVDDTLRKNHLKHCTSIVRLCKMFEQYLNLKSELPDEMRLLIWIDRLQLMSFASGIAMHEAFEDPEGMTDAEKRQSKDAHDAIDKISQLFINEFQSLCKHVHQISVKLGTIEQKLNAVLDGPDYEEGRKVMEDAKIEFQKLTSRDSVTQAK